MHVETFTYQNKTGWSVDTFPDLDSPQTLILAFFAPEFSNQHVPFDDLKKAYPNSHFAGCSTSGEIYGPIINDSSISIAVIKFDKTEIKIASHEIKKSDESYLVGKELANSLKKENLKGILILSEGLIVNGSTLVEGLKQNLSENVIITGGLAGDGKDFKQTWVLKDHYPSKNCISAIGLYGEDIEIGYGSKGGWDLFGPERLITRSKGNVLFEIDDQPVLGLYKKYLGQRAEDLPASALLFPLAISENPASDKYVVRTILSVDEKNQSMTFAGDVPEGWYAQLMKANFDRLIEGASMAGKMSITSKRKDQLGIAISCVGRRLVLGERSEEEVEATLDTLGKGASQIGFYSYGEISPSGLGSCDLHNQTMTLTTLSER